MLDEKTCSEQITSPKQRYTAWSMSVGIHALVLGLSVLSWPYSLDTSPSVPLFSPPIELHLQQAQETEQADALHSSLGEFIQSTRRLARAKTVSTADKGTALEAYLLAWQQQIETIGNQLYLNSAQHLQHQGELRILVALDAQGRVKRAQIRQSNGDRALERIAQDIIQKAGPFGSFPPEVLALVDELEIIKTWSFKNHFGLQEAAMIK